MAYQILTKVWVFRKSGLFVSYLIFRTQLLLQKFKELIHSKIETFTHILRPKARIGRVNRIQVS